MSGGPEAVSAGRDAAQEIAERLWLAAKLQVLTPRRAFSMNDAVDAALFLTDKMFKQQGTRVRCVLADGLPQADASMGEVEQSLVNVLMNACEAAAGGEVLVETRLAPGNRVEVRVTDTGAGIEPQAQEAVFEPFFSTRGRLGLGLTTARDLFRRAGGEVRMESRPGAGTSVFMALPASAR